MKFATDLDGVLNYFYDFFRERVKKITNIELPKEPDSFLIKIPGYTNEEIKKFIDFTILESQNIKPNLFNIKYAAKISKLFNEPLLIITSRKQESEKVTKFWLNKYLLPFTKYEVRFTGENKRKSELLDPDTLFFVDDYYFNSNDVADKVKLSFLIKKKYNDGKKLKENVLIIKNIKDVYLTILQYLEENHDKIKLYKNKNQVIKEILNYSHLSHVIKKYLLDNAMASVSIPAYESPTKSNKIISNQKKEETETEDELERKKEESKTEADEQRKVSELISNTKNKILTGKP